MAFLLNTRLTNSNFNIANVLLCVLEKVGKVAIPKEVILERRSVIRYKVVGASSNFKSQTICFLNGRRRDFLDGQLFENQIVAARVWLLINLRNQLKFVFATGKSSVEEIQRSWSAKIKKAFNHTDRYAARFSQVATKAKLRRATYVGSLRHFQSGRS